MSEVLSGSPSRARQSTRVITVDCRSGRKEQTYRGGSRLRTLTVVPPVKCERQWENEAEDSSDDGKSVPGRHDT